MGIALYRKYRPQTLAEITGQNHIRITLANELAGGSVAHSYLFTGPRGVGKTSMARIFAKALNCLKRKEGESEPCNDCDACNEQRTGRSMDVIEIDAASNTGVDNVRENVIEHVRFAPTSRRYKIFIIDEVHMLSTSAWNALLKTLEEPPAHAVFIMATTEIHKVPATIISRCQRFDFKRIPLASMIERLKHMSVGEGVDVDDAVLEAVARLGDGCLRDAESMLEQVLSLDEKKIGLEQAALVLPRSNRDLVVAFVAALAGRQGSEAIELVNKLVEEGVDLQQFVNETIEYLRALLVAALGAPSAVEMTDATKRLSAGHIVRLINSFMAARVELKSTPIPQLPLELVAAEHCGDAAAFAEKLIANNPIPHSPTPNGAGKIPKAPEPVVIKPQPIAPSAPVKPLPPAAATPAPLRAETEQASDQSNEAPTKAGNSTFDISHSTLAAQPAPPVETKMPDRLEASSQPLPLETLALRWDELCAAVQDENPSLPFLLRVSRPLRFEDGELVIGVQYKLHADKLNQMKNKDSIIRGLTALYNCAIIPVRAEISQPNEAGAVSNPVTDSLLAQFGGTVVE
jgi:DNA polymerase-3 subunit gamma/tau